MRILFPLAILSLAAFCITVIAYRAAFADAPTAEKPAAIETLPASRGGQDLLGTPLPQLHFDRWLNTKDNKPPQRAGSVTLYPLGTGTCPYTAATLPAI